MSARTAAVACNQPWSVIDLMGGKSNCQIARHNGFFRSQIMLLRFFQVHIQNPHSQGSDLKNCKLSAAAETDLILQTEPGTPQAGLGGIFLFHVSGYALLNRSVGQVPPWKRAEDKMDVTLPLAKPCKGWAEAARPGEDRLAAPWCLAIGVPGAHSPSERLGSRSWRHLGPHWAVLLPGGERFSFC